LVHRDLDGGQVLESQPFEYGDLVGEAIDPIRQPVGEAGGAEPPVASRRRPPATVALHQDHVGRGVVLFGEQRGPQPGVATAHHNQIGMMRTDQWWSRLGGRRVVEPEGQRKRVGERLGTVHVGQAIGGRSCF